MQISNVQNSIPAANRPATRQIAANDGARNDQATGGSRALIPLSPTQRSAPVQPLMRHPANFLAHLIATEQALPQTRERRRMEPAVAVATYAAANHQGAAEIHALSRAA